MNLEPKDSRNDSSLIAIRTLAVIDIGASSIRLQLAELMSDGQIKYQETLTHAVSLGKESFTTGIISRETIDECVRVLKIFRRKLEEYTLTPQLNVRVIATSGLREANNRLEFQDRVYIATGFEIEPFDEAELHRVTYLGIQPYLTGSADVFSGDSVVSEVGGGTTEFLYLQQGNVKFSRTFRMGSLRLRKIIEEYDAPLAKTKKILTAQIEQHIQQIQHLIHDETAKYVALGGDIRFFMNLIQRDFRPGVLSEVSVDTLGQFVDQVLEKQPEQLVARYRLSLAEAQALGPALLAHKLLAKRFNNDVVYVGESNMRRSMLQEMAGGFAWTDSIRQQILSSAKQFARKYDTDMKHAEAIADFATQLFDDLRDIHQLDPRYRSLLELAALLHEVGMYVSGRSFHKHSMYLIQNSELFGVSQRSLFLVSLIARYHRRATPQPTHEGYNTLDRENRIVVAKLASLLRLAVALESSRSQRIKEITCKVEAKQVTLHARALGDISAEQLECQQSGEMFENLFGIDLQLVNVDTESRDDYL